MLSHLGDVARGGGGQPRPAHPRDPRGSGDEVVAWSDAYDERFDEDDFTAELFSSDADLRAFDERGRELAQRLAEAVGDRYVVRYHSRRGPDLGHPELSQDEPG